MYYYRYNDLKRYIYQYHKELENDKFELMSDYNNDPDMINNSEQYKIIVSKLNLLERIIFYIEFSLEHD